MRFFNKKAEHIVKNLFKILCGFLLSFIVLFSFFSVDTAQAAMNAKLERINYSTYGMPNTGIKLNTKLSNCTYSINNTTKNAIKVVQYGSEVDFTAKMDGKSCEMKNLIDVIFTNVGSIGGRQIDVKVTLSNLSGGLFKNGGYSDGGYMCFAYVSSSGLWIGGQPTPDSESQYVLFTIEYDTTIYYHDDNSIVQQNCYQIASDIDRYTKNFQETWYAYYPDFYKFIYYNTSTINYDYTNDYTAWYQPSQGINYQGNDSYSKGSAIGVTKSGSFSGGFQEGNCATKLEIYTTYSDTAMNDPVKEITGDKVYQPGDTVTFTMTWNINTEYNDVYDSYSSLVFSDQLPDGMTYKSSTLECGSSSSSSTGNISFDDKTNTVYYIFEDTWLQNLDNYKNQTFTWTITCTVDDDAEGALSNTAFVDVSGIEYTSNTVTIRPTPDVNITKVADKKIYSVGETVTYTLNIHQTNPDAEAAENVVVSDSLPTGLTLSGTPTASGVSGTASTSGNSFTMTFPTLKYGETATITVKAIVEESALNTEEDEDDNIVYDGNTLNNQAIVTVNGEYADEDDTDIQVVVPKIKIEKSADYGPYRENDTVTFTISVTQTKTNAIGNNVVVQDTLPDGLTLSGTPSISGVSGTVNVSDNGFTANIPTLNYDETATITVTATTDEETAGMEFTNLATASVQYGNTVEDDADIGVMLPDLSIEKDVDQDECIAGDIVTYTVDLKQTVEGITAHNVVITDILPGHLTLVSTPVLSGVDGEVSDRNTRFTIYIDSLAYGETASVTFQALVSSEDNGMTLDNVVTATANSVDEVSDNAKIKVVEGNYIYKLMSDTSSEVPTGSTITFRVEVYDADTSTWSPASGIQYITMDGYHGDYNTTDCFRTSETLNTGNNGKITLTKGPDGYPFICFPKDKVYANVYENMNDGQLRIVELTNEMDEAWGFLTGYNGEGYDSDPSIFTTYADTFYNANDNQLTFYVEKEIESDTAYDDNFTFSLFHLTSASTMPLHTIDDVQNYEAGVNVKYTLYDAATDAIMGEYYTDADGHFTLKAGQYAKFIVPTDTVWLAYEEATAKYTLSNIEDNGADNAYVMDEKYAVVQDNKDIKPTGTIVLTLYDEDGSVLSGGTFDLYRNGVKIQSDLVTNASGKITVKKLSAGEYYFVQTGSPDGYCLPTDTSTDTISIPDTISTPTKYSLEMINPTNGYCIHWMSWDEIIEQCKKDPTVFQTCLENGCTHSVELSLNDTIASSGYDVDSYGTVKYAVCIYGINHDTDADGNILGLTFGPATDDDYNHSYKAHCGAPNNDTSLGSGIDGDGTGMLYDSIYNEYRRWNGTEPDDCWNTGGWPASKIRANLNGKDELTNTSRTEGAATYALDADKALFSCFPEELQNAIAPKEVESDTVYNDFTNDDDYQTTYDRLWCFSTLELYNDESYSNNDIRLHEGYLYERSELREITPKTYSDLISYDESGTAQDWWSRTVSWYGRENISSISSFGSLYSKYASRYQNSGISPGFCLVGPKDTTNEVKYVVKLYGICSDAYSNNDGESKYLASLTFGPATGENHLDSYVECSSDTCIHKLSWDEIIQLCNENQGDEEALTELFGSCLENGCTKSVDLTANDTLFNMETVSNMQTQDYTGDGVSCLYYLLNGTGAASYTYGSNWNDNANGYKTSDPANVYSRSRIRAMLIGDGEDAKTWVNEEYNDYYGVDTLCDESNCLLSCFPKELQDAMVPRSTVNGGSDDGGGNKYNDKTTYDKLWLYTPTEIGLSSTYDDAKSSDYGVNSKNADRIAYEFSGSSAFASSTCAWWTRARNSNSWRNVHYVTTSGSDSNDYFTDNYGLAPGFSIGASKVEVKDPVFSIYSKDDNSLTFYSDTEVPKEGSVYNKKTVTNVYTGFDEESYSSYTSVPWYSIRSDVVSVSFDESFSNVKPVSTAYWFYNFTNCTEMNITNLDTSNVTAMNYMFYYCSNLASLNVSSMNTSNVTVMNHMFNYCSSLTTLDLSGFDTSKVTNMAMMFGYCRGLTSLNLSGLKTSNVTNMNSVFYNCDGLTSLDVSGFDTSNVIYMSSTFSGCSSLTSLNVSGLNTSNVTDMSNMFYNCSSLTSLNVSGFNTSNVTDMSFMFSGCSNLISLDVSGFNTSNVTDMRSMFQNCSDLTTLDVSEFDTSNVKQIGSMFSKCDNLTTIYSDDTNFITTNVTSSNNMFNSCKKLVGGNGTSYSVNKVDASMAHVDAAGNPGYFTDVSKKP